jgi:hypothetical protein
MISDDVMAQAKALAAMKDEPLHPDLVPYQVEGSFGMMIKHPLINDLLPINGLVNKTYTEKKALLSKWETQGKWHDIIHLLIERPWRTEYLIDYVMGRDESTGMPFSVVDLDLDADMRDLVAFVWTDSENIDQHIEDWLAITDGHIPGEPLLFGDQPAFDAMPERIELWRGDCADGGWSWSTERKVAEFFARRWNASHPLLHGWVDKRYVFGYLTNRSEYEIMVRSEHIEDMTCVLP